MNAFGNVVENRTKQWNMETYGIVPIITEQQFCSTLPGQVSGCSVGMMKGGNGTKLNSFFTINNGKNVKGKFHAVEAFNGRSSLPENTWKRIGNLNKNDFSNHHVALQSFMKILPCDFMVI